MTFDEWMVYAWGYWKARPEQRKGQAYFNALEVHRPDIASGVRGTPVDPFFNDSQLVPFLDIVEESW